ncbi:hypothetical protein SAMN04488087_1652 [Rhodothermus profundi]|uniref:Uncharacterized protein n=1 Tax=Rhodothermus profundi TaxID=633813 RepID=A0A1M6UD29_9BACT|nr:hypothetical protein SAMN04488087_1652 [Rhodothermus profundi]
MIATGLHPILLHTGLKGGKFTVERDFLFSNQGGIRCVSP